MVGEVGLLRNDFTIIIMMIISRHDIVIFISRRRLIGERGFVFSVKVKSEGKGVIRTRIQSIWIGSFNSPLLKDLTQLNESFSNCYKYVLKKQPTQIPPPRQQRLQTTRPHLHGRRHHELLVRGSQPQHGSDPRQQRVSAVSSVVSVSLS